MSTGAPNNAEMILIGKTCPGILSEIKENRLSVNAPIIIMYVKTFLKFADFKLILTKCGMAIPMKTIGPTSAVATPVNRLELSITINFT